MLHQQLKTRLKQLACMALVAACWVSVPASASLIIELSGNENDDTIATFSGSGITDGVFQFNIDVHEIGDFVLPTGPNNSWFNLANPVVFASGVTIERFHVDHNPAPTLDDLRIGMSSFVGSGISFAVNGSSLIEGLAFSSLIPGTYGESNRPDNAIVGGVSLIVHPYEVDEPATFALIGLGFGALLWQRRRRANAVMDS